MLYKALFFCAALVVALNVNAQSVKVFGKVTDSLSAPMPGTTVMLIDQKDSILKSFGVTDKDGNFVITNVKPNDYLFKANLFGYQPKTMQFSIGPSSADTSLGYIQLTPKMLNTVTVDADYIPIRIKGDTIEYDSRAFETGQHDVVENLLEQLPGVEVQPDGSIKVQGKTVEKILVDGEEFFGNDPTIATKNLPADAVDKVQVFEKDSEMAEFTGVDDGDESTTINLTLKEDRKKGYFGNAELGYGDQNRYKFKGNVNYFKDKVQISGIGLANNINESGFSINDYISFMGGIQSLMDGSGTLNFDGDNGLPLDFGQNNGFLSTNAFGTNFNYKPSKNTTFNSSLFFNTFDKTFDRNIDRTTYLQDSSLFSQEATLQNSFAYNSRAKVHFKQTIDSSQFINADLTGQWTLSDNTSQNELSNFDGGNALRSSFLTSFNQDDTKYQGNIRSDYRKKFAKVGQYTGGGAGFGINNQSNTGLLGYENSLYSPELITTLVNQIQTDRRKKTEWAANWMFSQPMGKKQLIQAEAEYDQSDQSRNRRVTDQFAPDDTLFNEALSGNAAYMVQNYGGNVRHKYVSKKLKTTTGFRYNQVVLHSPGLFSAARSFDYALPFFALNWEIDKSSDLRLNYRTRVDAPELTQLQTIANNTNPAEVLLGNAALRPEYVHDASIEYNLFNEFNFTHLMIRLGAARIENKINYSQWVDANFNRVFTPENNGNEDQLNTFLSFGTSLSPIKTKFSITNTSNLTSGQLRLNEMQDAYTSFYSNSGVVIENTKKKVVNIRVGAEATYSKSVYSQNETLNNDFFSWNYSAGLTLKVKDDWIFKANGTHNFYPGFTQNMDQLIINASIARNFLKSRKLQVYVAAFDILNQNTGINQAYFLNYFEQERTATLARYFMVGVKYAFQRMGGKQE